MYRLYEAITHGGEAIKAIINEEFGDGEVLWDHNVAGGAVALV